MTAPEATHTRRRDRWIVGLIAIVTVALIGYNLFMFFAPSLMLTGRQVERITLFDLERGNTDDIILPSGVVLIHFWATWCSSCVAEISLLSSYASRVPIIGVLKDPVRIDHLRMLDTPWKNYRGLQTTFEDFMVTAVPVTILIRDHVVSEVQMGPLTREVLEQWIAPAR